MNAIENIFEPTRLYLVWHHSREDKARHRRVVGELVKEGDDTVFRYLKKSPDYSAALNEGFDGFPAFERTGSIGSHSGAMDVFVRRLPPRKREDFKEYLAQYSLPVDFKGSDFSLLAYTGAKLASDTFELCPDLSDAKAPLDLVVEVSGIQYYVDDVSLFSEGDLVDFVLEPENEFDECAIKVVCLNNKIGYLSRALSPSFSKFLGSGNVEARVLKVVSHKNKPRILILVRSL